MIKKIVLSIVIVLNIFIITLYGSESLSASIRGTNRISIGQTFEVVFELGGNQVPYGNEIKFTYDKELLELVKCKSEIIGFKVGPIINENQVICASTQIGEGNKESTGPIKLYSVTFKGIRKGNASIYLDLIKLAIESDTGEIEYASYNGNAFLKVNIVNEKSSDSDSNKTTITEEYFLEDEFIAQEDLNTSVFKDLDSVLWAKDQIEFLAEKGIANGNGDHLYLPEKPITRADFICLLMRAMKFESILGEKFQDVNELDYYFQPVSIARKLGITKGIGDNKFDPKAMLSREEIMAFTARALLIKNNRIDYVVLNNELSVKNFTDFSKVHKYALESIEFLIKIGLVKGDDFHIRPNNEATRAEAAVMIYRVYQLVNKQEYLE